MIVHMDDTWELLMDLVMAERARIPQIAAEFRLSPPQMSSVGFCARTGAVSIAAESRSSIGRAGGRAGKVRRMRGPGRETN